MSGGEDPFFIELQRQHRIVEEDYKRRMREQEEKNKQVNAQRDLESKERKLGKLKARQEYCESGSEFERFMKFLSQCIFEGRLNYATMHTTKSAEEWVERNLLPLAYEYKLEKFFKIK